jgi:hypothetical protein
MVIKVTVGDVGLDSSRRGYGKLRALSKRVITNGVERI